MLLAAGGTGAPSHYRLGECLLLLQQKFLSLSLSVSLDLCGPNGRAKKSLPLSH